MSARLVSYSVTQGVLRSAPDDYTIIQSTPGNSNLPLTRSNFHFPSDHFLYNFTLDNSNFLLMISLEGSNYRESNVISSEIQLDYE